MKIIIKNFKSIKKIEMKIKNGIQYIVGKNESGKSNILEAFKRLSKEELNEEDKNINSTEEDKLEISCFLWSETVLALAEEWKTLLEIKNEKIDFFYILNENGTKTSLDQSSFLNKKIFEIIEKFEIYENISEEMKKNAFNEEIIEKIAKKMEEIKGGKHLFYLVYYERQRYSFLVNLKKLIEKTKRIFLKPNILIFRKDKIIGSKYTYANIDEKEELKGLWKKIDIQPEKIKKLIEIEKKTNFSAKKKNLEEKINKNLGNFLDEEIKHTRGIKLEVEMGDDELTFIPRDVFDDKKLGNYGHLQTRSEGIKAFLAVYLFLAGIEENKEEEKIVLIDEPDLHLHASAVTDLKRYFEKIAKSNPEFKILIITHNPYFIDSNNFHQMSWVFKKSKEEGTQLIENFARKSGKEDWETLSPFFYQLGIDRKAFIQLDNPNCVHLFVEGFQDMILLDAMKTYLKIEKKIFIIPKNSATRNNHSLISLVTAFNQKLPYFLFDYDQAGEDGLRQIKKNPDLYSLELKNAFFINLKNEYKKGDEKTETQNLFGNDKFENKTVIENKDTFFYLQLAKAIKNGKFQPSEQTIENFQKIFTRIKGVEKK